MHENWLDRLLQMDDGAVVFYRWTGADNSRDPVVLCDGIGCDGFIWRYIAPVLARHRRVFHIHIRGHGSSPLPPDPERVSIEILADDVASMLDDAGVRSAVLVGHSMGVQTCLEVYRRHEDRVRGMVLTCGSYGSPLRTFYGTDVLHHLLPVIRVAFGAAGWPLRYAWRRLLPTESALKISTLTEVNGELISHEDMMIYLDHLSRVDPVLFLRMLTYADRHSASDLLERITVPVLLVEGDRDGFTPLTLSREMEHRIPEATLLVVPGGTHVAPLERPELVTRGVEAFTQWL